jgi:hypothetical protein
LDIDLAAHFLEDFADRLLVFWLAGKSAIEVDQMQAPRALVNPSAGHGGRIFTESGDLIHVALLEAHTLAVFEVNGRNQKHGDGAQPDMKKEGQESEKTRP